MKDNKKTCEDKFKFTGKVTRRLRDKDNNIIEEYHNENLIVNSGKNRLIRNVVDGTRVKLVGCMIGRDVNTPMNINNNAGWIPNPPNPSDTLATITGDGQRNPRQQAFNKVEYLDKENNVLGYKTDIEDTLPLGRWKDVFAIRYYVLFKSTDVDMIVNAVGMVMNDDAKTPENLFSKHTFPWMYLKADRGYSLEIIWTYDIL